MNGTEAIITGVDDKDIETARGFFLQFSNEQVLEVTRFGEILAGERAVRREYM